MPISAPAVAAAAARRDEQPSQEVDVDPPQYPEREVRRGVGADREERHVAEVEQPGEPDDHVESERHHHVGGGEHEVVEDVPARAEGEREQHGAGEQRRRQQAARPARGDRPRRRALGCRDVTAARRAVDVRGARDRAVAVVVPACLGIAEPARPLRVARGLDPAREDRAADPRQRLPVGRIECSDLVIQQRQPRAVIRRAAARPRRSASRAPCAGPPSRASASRARRPRAGRPPARAVSG